MNHNLLRIGFIGPGSIGSLFGGCLASVHTNANPLEIFFFCRKGHAKVINKHGIKIYSDKGNITLTNIKAFENAEDFTKISINDKKYKLDYLFLTTKTYDSERAMIQYKELINSSNWLIILQNGIGNEELVKKYCDENKIIRIITSHGALLKEYGHVYHTGLGFTKIGFVYLKPQKQNHSHYKSSHIKLNMLKNHLDAGGLEIEIVDDIIKHVWEKAFVNIGINALGALTRLNNGNLLENEKLKQLMSAAVKEALEVAKLKCIELSDRDYVRLMYSVAEKTYNNKNSMLQDILKGNLTEIDFLNGRIVSLAKEVDIKVPINEMLTCLIKGLEESFR